MTHSTNTEDWVLAARLVAAETREAEIAELRAWRNALAGERPRLSDAWRHLPPQKLQRNP